LRKRYATVSQAYFTPEQNGLRHFSSLSFFATHPNRVTAVYDASYVLAIGKPP